MSALTPSALHQKIQLGRRIEGSSAVLLPFLADGRFDETGFRNLLESTFASGKARPDFTIYSGNVLALDQVMYGSDYLLGLAGFYPEAFALRDVLWEQLDVAFYLLNDLLQYLGFLAFRAPLPGYKHTAAQFHLCGLLKNSAGPSQGGYSPRIRFGNLAKHPGPPGWTRCSIPIPC